MTIIADLLGNSKCCLQKLGLEGNRFTDTSIRTLCEGLSYNETLLDLNLARNGVTEFSAGLLAEYIASTTSLQKLDLHWNKIRGQGAVKLCEALSQNNTLQILDLSFNALGSVRNFGVARLLSETFASNDKLFHVDISHNKLSQEDCKTIGEGIKKNHNIMGIHMEGNQANVDSLGFVNGS